MGEHIRRAAFGCTGQVAAPQPRWQPPQLAAMTDAPWRKRGCDPEALRREGVALQLLGPPAVRLLSWHDEELVVEQITPGTPVARRVDDEATVAIAQALMGLWVPAPPGCDLPSVEQECQALNDLHVTRALPARLVDAAQQQLAGLLSSNDEAYVLHGDLHHENLLWSAARDGWVAIDPHGVVGERCYDVGPLLINPWAAGTPALAARRLDLLREILGIARERLAAWGLVRAVLAEAWMVQDTGRPHGAALRVATTLAQL